MLPLFAMMSAVSLVVLLVMVESAYMAVASPADVNIYHQIPGQDTVRVDCMKMGPGKAHHIFTPQTLVYGQHWGWGFKPNDWGYTKYYCDFSWRSHSKRVRVWADSNPEESPTEDPRPCTHCLWDVTTQGFFRMTSDRGEPPALEASWT